MGSAVDIWKFLAGLGLFLYGLHLLETALRFLAGPTFRRFLRDQTRTHIRSTLVGTAATAVLQSSSVVNLILLAFVGAGILTLGNALGVVYGSNLGTTFTGWIVAWLGFKMDFAKITLPLIALGSLGVAYFPPERRSYHSGALLLGFGMLLFGLAYMKESVEQLATLVDLEALGFDSVFSFLLFGIVFTAVIQSSSATMMITLSALNAGIVDLYQAAAIIVGADLGTTGTVLIGALKGDAAKKRVALAHFLFNVVTVLIAFAGLRPLLAVITGPLKVTDPLIGLVVFHSMFNFLPILLFLPFTNGFARFLEARFKVEDIPLTPFSDSVSPEVPEAAVAGAGKDCGRYLSTVAEYILAIAGRPQADSKNFPGGISDEDKYHRIKSVEVQLIRYLSQVQKGRLSDEESARIVSLLKILRHGAMAAKSIKDVRHNIREFFHSENKQVQEVLHAIFNDMTSMLARLGALASGDPVVVEVLSDLMHKNKDHYQRHQRLIYERVDREHLSSTLNVNAEAYAAVKNLIAAHSELLLSPQHSEALASVPGG